MAGTGHGTDGSIACPACAADNPLANRFCFDCGASLARCCPRCETNNPAAARFCGACGAPLAIADAGRCDADRSHATLAERLVASALSEPGERKQVSVLFADVAGSTELIRDLDAEDSVTILEPAIAAMTESVREHEGTVNRVQGDGITALFGAPIAHENHAGRACLAALAMRDRVAALPGSTLEIRVGINTGDVVVRAIRNDLTTEYEADGPAVHLAARMEQLAAPGTVRATAATLELAEGVVEARRAEPTPVRGFDGPIEQFELLRAVPAASRWEIRARRGLSAFVGRESELDTLGAALASASQGDGQIVAIVAEAGMGKSRLLHEFLSHRVSDDWAVRVAGATSDGASTPFAPIRTLLRAVLDARQDDDQLALERKLTGLVLEFGDEFAWAGAPLAGLLDLPVADPGWPALEPGQRRQLMIDAFRVLASKRAERGPLLLVFEDLHWIDAETQAALDALVEAIPAAPVLLLVTYRPEYAAPWTMRGWHRAIRLTGLGGATAIEFVRRLVGPDRSLADLVKLLVSRTEGRPLFVEEIVRALAEDRVLEGQLGAYRLTRPVESVRIPASVQAVLAARIDRLEPRAKRSLQVAAVIGREVPRGLLGAVLDVDDDVLDGDLATLRSSEFLFDRLAGSEPGYLFKHALTRSVAYESLLREQRRELHARTLRAMEHRFTGRLDEHLESLGRHAIEGACWAEAMHYLRRAGNKATDQSAYTEARTLLEDALRALEQMPSGTGSVALGADLRMELRPALGALGHYPAILERLEESEPLVAELGDRGRLLAIGADKTHALYMLGHVAQAIAVGERAVGAAARDGDRRTLIQASCNLAQAHVFGGAPARALAIVDPFVAELRGAMRTERLGTTATSSALWLGNLCGTAALLGDFERSADSGTAARGIAAETGKPFDIAITHFWSGFGLNQQGRTAEAEVILRAGLEVARDPAIAFSRQWGAGELARTCGVLGKVDEARALVGESTSVSHALGIALPALWFDAYAAEIELAASVSAAPVEILRGLLLEVTRTGALWLEPLVCRLLAEALVRASPAAHAEARTLLERALAHCVERERRPEQAHVELALARLDARLGRRGEAEAHAARAAARYEALAMSSFLADAERVGAGD